VVDEDLFIPILTYVFGEAQLNGRVAVISSHRLLNERYGLPADPGLAFDRLLKEAVHELGHVFGLLHCQDRECAMHISTYVEDIDLKSAALCTPCRRQLAARVRG
jgi:archaemetzincin